MDIVFLLLPLTLALAIAAIIAFIWAVKREQFDDLQTPAMRMLLDEDSLQSKKGSDYDQDHNQ